METLKVGFRCGRPRFENVTSLSGRIVTFSREATTAPASKSW
jgi:hypothetical protein